MDTGVEDTQADRVHADPLSGDFLRETECEGVDGPFRRGIVDVLAGAADAGGGG
jgi:hypothetical protein